MLGIATSPRRGWSALSLGRSKRIVGQVPLATTPLGDIKAGTAEDCRSGRERARLRRVWSYHYKSSIFRNQMFASFTNSTTDAPLIPIQCQRLARRATTGLAWVGGIGANGSGDIFIAFSTSNHVGQNDKISKVTMLAPDAMTSLFRAAAEATEEAILNAMCMAETMTGRDNRVIHALPLDLLQDVMQRYRAQQGV